MVSREVYSVDYNAIHGERHRSGRCEMDSHADTCVAGSNCVVLEYTGRSAEVEAYSPDYPSKQIPIATVATAYDCPTSGATYVIIINEALYFGDSLPFSLLSPNQKKHLISINVLPLHTCWNGRLTRLDTTSFREIESSTV